MNKVVVLVPGAGVGGADLFPIAWRFQQRGYRVKIFFYLTWANPIARSAYQLYRWLSAQPDPIIHLVGHSLGGLVILYCLAHHEWPRPGRVVTIGTPHTNIAIAHRLLRFKSGHWLVGRGVASALNLLPLPVPTNRDVGIIAGSRDLGTGRLLAVPRPNDMAVSVAETQHPAIHQRVVLPVSHVHMLFSQAVVEAMDDFLASGRFSSTTS